MRGGGECEALQTRWGDLRIKNLFSPASTQLGQGADCPLSEETGQKTNHAAGATCSARLVAPNGSINPAPTTVRGMRRVSAR